MKGVWIKLAEKGLGQFRKNRKLCAEMLHHWNAVKTSCFVTQAHMLHTKHCIVWRMQAELCTTYNVPVHKRESYSSIWYTKLYASGFHLSKSIDYALETPTSLRFDFSWYWTILLISHVISATCCLFHVLKMRIWPLYPFWTNVVSVWRGGEDKGRAPAKALLHLKWGCPAEGVPAGEGRLVCHGCAWPCDAC